MADTVYEFRYKVSRDGGKFPSHTQNKLDTEFYAIAIASHFDPKHNSSIRYIMPNAEQNVLVNDTGPRNTENPNPNDGIYRYQGY